MKQFLIFTLLLLSGTAIAQDSFQKELFSTHVVLKYRNELDLSEKQVSNIKKIHQDHITKFNSIKWDLDAELQALSTLLASNQVDESKSMTKMEKVMSLEDQLKRIRLSMLIKIKNELNPSQQKQLKRLRTEKDMKSLSLVTAINDDQKISIIVGGDKMSEIQPLYVITSKEGDKIVTLSFFEQIKAADIETITVLKGKKAIERYGEQGKNGVIVIQLKKQ